MILRNRALLIILSSSFFFIAGNSYCQKYNFTSYTIASGLPNNQINDITQDQFGKLWIGTMNGACTFDGKSFTKFSQDNILSNNPVKHIFIDSKNNVWLSTIRKGLCLFNGVDFQFFTINNGLLSDVVNAVAEDAKGNIWIGTSEGLNKYDGKKFTSYTTSAGLVNDNIFSLLTDSSGNLWIATIGGVSKYDGKKFTSYTTDQGLAGNIAYCVMQAADKKIWIGTSAGASGFDGEKFISYTDSGALMNNKVLDIIQDSRGRMWFATFGGGVSYYNNSTFESLTEAEGLCKNFVTAAFTDREENFWFGTTNGLCKYSGNRFVTFTTENGLNHNNILSVFADTSQNIFFGTLASGLNFYDGTAMHNFSEPDALNNNTIRSICRDRQGYYWLGTTGGPYRFNFYTKEVDFPAGELNRTIIYCMTEDRKGNLYFGTDKGIYIKKGVNLKKISASNGLISENVRALFEDNKGIIWIGTLQGTYYLNKDTAVSFNELYNLPKAPVTSIIQDEEGNIIISTYDFGLVVYSRMDKKNPVRIINKKSGLINERISFSFLDRNSVLWLGTPAGIDGLIWPSYTKNSTVIINHFDKSNSYFGVETNTASADREGNVWFGSVNGAVKYDIRSGISRQAIPLVSLTGIQLFLENVDWKKRGFKLRPETGLPDNPVFSFNNNYLSFFFSGVYLTAPEEVQYRFMLEGFEEEWSPATRQMIASYSNIPSGNFTFKVKASANGTNWSNPATYSFEIKPSIWQTTLFYILYVLTAAGLVFLFLRMRTRSLKQSQVQLRKKIDQRTQELKTKNLELAKLSLVASETDNAVMIFDEKKDLEWVNEGFTKMTGYTLEAIKNARGKSIYELTSINIVDILDESISQKKASVYESTLITKTGETIWVSSTLNPIVNENNKLRNIVVIDTDITYRKMMEETIKDALHEKGLLLKEIHHRVKNNLQTIISLFNLQSSFVTDEEAYKALKEGQNRIKSMALIHERFYQSDGLSKIDFDEYIRRLSENLFYSFGTDPEQISVNVDSDKISLDIDSAVPCGLIINELLSNSLKHAFKEGSPGNIFISFKNGATDTYNLIIKDNGCGFPPGFKLENAESLGMQLIIALADQLDGKISLDSSEGAAFTLAFKRKE